MLGGILTQSKATWRAIFYFQAGLGAFFIALGCVALRSDHTETTYKKGLDWGGALLSTAGMALLTYSLAYVNLRRSSPFLAFAEMTQTHFVSHPNCGFDHSFPTFLFVPDLTSIVSHTETLPPLGMDGVRPKSPHSSQSPCYSSLLSFGMNVVGRREAYRCLCHLVCGTNPGHEWVALLHSSSSHGLASIV